MKAAPFVDDMNSHNQKVGYAFKKLAKAIKKRIIETDDNCTIMCFGSTGSGKSTLGFHFGNAFNDGKGVDVDLVGFDKKSWAESLSRMKDVKGLFGINDEANISKREAMGQYNKDVIDLLFSIRGKNMCLWMCNPSADYLDKVLVEEGLINFFVFINKKQKEYLIFSQKQVLNFVNKHGNLKFETMQKHSEPYSMWKGYFNAYTGKDWDSYLEKKNERMNDKLDLFVKKYAHKKSFNLAHVVKVLGITYKTGIKYARMALEDGYFEDKDIQSLTGVWQFSEEQIDMLATFIERKRAGEI